MSTSDRDFSRQSFLGARSSELLAGARVAIVGAGGGGSHIAQQLAHAGVGEFRLLDPQVIEASNLNRLVTATAADVERATPKVDILKRTILGVRPWTRVIAHQGNWQERIDLIADAHVLFGCVDSFQQRAFLESTARRFSIPFVDIGMDVVEVGDMFAVSGQMIMTRPGGPCMRCLGFLTDERLSAEENRYGDAGGNPQVVWTNGTLASLAVGAFVKLMTPWFDARVEYEWLELDGNTQIVARSRQPDFIPRPMICPHHGGQDGLGDPFFDLSRGQ